MDDGMWNSKADLCQFFDSGVGLPSFLDASWKALCLI